MAGLILLNVAIVLLIFIFAALAGGEDVTFRFIAATVFSVQITFLIWIVYVAIHFLQKFW